MSSPGSPSRIKRPRPLDPRVRLMLGLAAVAAVLLTRTRPVLVTESVLLFGAILARGRAGLRFGTVHMVWPMVSLVFLISMLAFDLDTAVDLSIRLINFFAVSAAFFQTLRPEELALTLRSLKVPHSMVFIILTAVRYVPLLGRALRNIHDAQTARGIDVRLRLTNVGRLSALVMPLLVQAFMLGENLAMAMESRGFARRANTEARLGSLTPRDILCTALGIATVLALLFWERWSR